MAEGELVCRNVINTNLAYGPKTCTVRVLGNTGVFVWDTVFAKKIMYGKRGKIVCSFGLLSTANKPFGMYKLNP